MTGRQIYLPIGDPNGIGPEIAVKTAHTLGPAKIILVGDRAVIEQACEIAKVPSKALEIEAVSALDRASEPGVVSAAAGRACLSYAARAIELAAGQGHAAVVAAPHNETAIAAAGIAFSGYPGFLAQKTGTDPELVFAMLVSPKLIIAHATLHLGLRAALDALSVTRIANCAVAADRALRQMGLAKPRLAACGINPHAGEGGLFGKEDEDITAPALAQARKMGIDIQGPYGADLLFADAAFDAYLAMYHDQGHIPIKQQGRAQSFALSIGTPVLFTTVAHGSAHDIAGHGLADPAALINIINRLMSGTW